MPRTNSEWLAVAQENWEEALGVLLSEEGWEKESGAIGMKRKYVVENVRVEPMEPLEWNSVGLELVEVKRFRELQNSF